MGVILTAPPPLAGVTRYRNNGSASRSRNFSMPARVQTLMARTAPLRQLTVTSPCPLTWDALPAGRDSTADHTRHCPHCDLDVHNLSVLTTAQADSLLASRPTGARLCVAYTPTPAGHPQTLDYHTPPQPRWFRSTKLRLTVATLGATLSAAAHAIFRTPRPIPPPASMVMGDPAPPAPPPATQPSLMGGCPAPPGSTLLPLTPPIKLGKI